MQAFGALLETGIGLATSEFGIGIPVAANGVDNLQAGLRELWTGQYVQTYTSQAIQWSSEELGASPSTAYNIGQVGNAAIGVAGTFGAGVFNEAEAGSWALSGLQRLVGGTVAEGAICGAAGGAAAGFAYSAGVGGSPLQIAQATGENALFSGAAGGVFGGVGGWVGTLIGRAGSDAEFIGPTIGRSGFRNAGEFSDAVAARYQQLYDEGHAITMRRVAQGLVADSPAAIGSEVDEFARLRLLDWLDTEGTEEGPGRLIQVNRRLYDPTGSGLYRIPDVYIPAAQSILDGSIALKTSATPQIQEFWSFSNSANVTIIRPSALVSGDVQGSYGIIQ